MEPKLKKKEFKNQKKTLIIVTALVISLFIGGSFALISNKTETEEVASFKTGNLNMEVSTSDTLSLAGELPKSYNVGFNNKDITLTLKNTGSIEIGKYEVKLEGDNTSTLNSKYIKYSVSEDNGTTYLAAKTLSDTNNIIYTGYSLKDTKVLKVKLWITEDADSEVLKKTYNGKIKVELYQNEDTIVDVVKSKLVSNYSGSNESFPGGLVAVNNDGNLYHEENDKEIREYRYSGPSVNNYVTFNNELWRILGIFEDEESKEHIKIVRNNALTGIPSSYTANGKTFNLGTGSNVYWNYDGNNYDNNWGDAGLMNWLNSTGTTNGYLKTLSSTAQNMIEDAKWYLGTVTYISSSSSSYGIKDTTIEAYKAERSIEGCVGNKGPSENSSQSKVESNSTCRVWANNSATWIGKIGLMYPSDYGFSTNSNYWNTKLMYGSFNGNASNSSWLQKEANHTTYEWLLSPSSGTSVDISHWTIAGDVNDFYANGVNNMRPSLYLKSNTLISGGDGTLENPYTLAINKNA